MSFNRNFTQGQDGVAHITYYDKEKSLSFVYDGTKGDFIDISVGGYAEPVIMRIPLTLDKNMSMIRFLSMFGTFCNEFARGYQPHD